MEIGTGPKGFEAPSLEATREGVTIFATDSVLMIQRWSIDRA